MPVINFFAELFRKTQPTINSFINKIKTTSWINQEKEIKIKIFNPIIAAATIIIKKAEKEEPWYITYWPIIVGSIVVLVGVGLCIYYYYPGSNGPDNSLSNIAIDEAVNDSIIFPGTMSDININGVLYHLSTDLDLSELFPWGGTEEEILTIFRSRSKAEIIDFLGYYYSSQPEIFKELCSGKLTRELYILLQTAMDIYFT